ncbi:hypothetical protein LCGC14_3129290, partial [marine sediment metagenome]
SLGVSVPLDNEALPRPGQQYGVFIMGALSNVRSAIRLYFRPFIDKPDDEDDPADTPDDPGGEMIKPTASQIRVPEAFKRWMQYPSTLDIGEVALTINTTSIDIEWSRRDELRALDRYEDGDRFGRACLGIYIPDEWVGIHGEHVRIKDGEADETGGTTIDMWGAPDEAMHTTLGQTLRAKSKDRAVEDSGYEPELPMVFFVVTHDQNPKRQRTPLHYFGFSAGGGDDPTDPIDPPDDPGLIVLPSDEWIMAVWRRAAELMRP